MMAGDRQQLSGRRTDALVEMVDLMPTLLELAAITIR
jgi:arylsulfatase A-like enzyme